MKSPKAIKARINSVYVSIVVLIVALNGWLERKGETQKETIYFGSLPSASIVVKRNLLSKMKIIATFIRIYH
ncbi:MAG: hypothetical protein ACI8ZN_002300 [Bacteroidia bacterium]